jgi:hypothetical protein
MIKLTPERQLIHVGSACVSTKATGVTMALTKGSCLGYWKHLLAFREKRCSGGIVSPTDERRYLNLVRS